MMSVSPSIDIVALLKELYVKACANHGDLNLDFASYSSHLNSIIQRHLGEDATPGARSAFVSTLHTTDLYLAAACAHSSELAWVRFSETYKRLIQYLAQSHCPTMAAADELASGILSYLYLPDSSGRTRIASYDGRSSISTWLAAIVHHRAVKERRRKVNNAERLDRFRDKIDLWTEVKIGLQIRSATYGHAIDQAIEKSGKSLTERERFILLLRYQDGISGTEIATILNVHASTVTRQLQGIYEKLRSAIVASLAEDHGLNPAAVEESILETIENPKYSIMTAIKAC
jgi:RNA polymerase sigma-70 factor